MATVDSDNVTPFPDQQARPQDPTGAERQARWRENQRNGSRKKARRNNKKREADERAVTPGQVLAVTPLWSLTASAASARCYGSSRSRHRKWCGLSALAVGVHRAHQRPAVAKPCLSSERTHKPLQ